MSFFLTFIANIITKPIILLANASWSSLEAGSWSSAGRGHPKDEVVAALQIEIEAGLHGGA